VVIPLEKSYSDSNGYDDMESIPYVSSVRPSPIAGRWYPGDARILAKQVDEYLASAQLPSIKGEVIGAVVPHAGYMYSGKVAAYAYAALKNYSPEIVVIASPLHQYSIYPILTTAHRAYMTPLGEVKVAEDLMALLNRELHSRLGEKLTALSYDQEHSLEIQLPFLQRIYKEGFQLLPIMVRDTSLETVQQLGISLSEIIKDKNYIIIASTDLSHFYPQAYAEKYDNVMIQKIKDLDPNGVIMAEEEGKGYACGRGALAAILWAAKKLGANKAEILKYSTSGDVTGDFSEVVGYVAAAIIKEN